MTTFEREIRQRVELIPNRLYYVSLSKPPPPVSSDKYFFSIDKKMIYWNFYLDFGPLNLGHVMAFKTFLKEKLANPAIKTIYFYSSMAPEKRANAAFLICAFMLLEHGKTAQEAFRYFKNYPYSFPNWHDATVGACPFVLTILDTLMGLEKAKQLKFFDYDDWNQEEYEYYEQIEHGDLNWYVQKKFIAFAGPHEEKVMSPGGYQTNTPEDYLPYFKKNNVQLVVRLNHPMYNAQKFIKNGVDHIDLIFTDGSNPPSTILSKFLKKCEETPGAIAVHCKAGLGRTGTCVACYMMKHYRLTAEEVIGWMRIVRPGSVIGPQQQFLKDIQNKMWKDGDLYRAQLQQANLLSSPSPRVSASPISSPVPSGYPTASPTHTQMTVSQSSPLSRSTTPSGISRPQLNLNISESLSSTSRPGSATVSPRALTPTSSTLSNTGALSLTPRSSALNGLSTSGNLTPTNSSSRPSSRGATFSTPNSKPSSFLYSNTPQQASGASSPNTTYRPLNLNSFASNSNSNSSSRPLSRGRTSSASSSTPMQSAAPTTPLAISSSSSDYDGSQGDQLRARRFHNSQTSTPVNPNMTSSNAPFSPGALTSAMSSASPYTGSQSAKFSSPGFSPASGSPYAGNTSFKYSASTPVSPNTSGKYSPLQQNTSTKKPSAATGTPNRSPYGSTIGSPTRGSVSSSLDSTPASPPTSNRFASKFFGIK